MMANKFQYIKFFMCGVGVSFLVLLCLILPVGPRERSCDFKEQVTPGAQEIFIDDDHNRWLPANTKLVQIAYPDRGRVVFLTRPMKKDESAETYTLLENGIGGSPIKIIECKVEYDNF